MGFLSSLFGEKVPNENRTKPFSSCASAQERKEWFARTRPWHRVSPQVIDVVVSKLDGDPVKFDAFVRRSTELSLVERYQSLTPEAGSPNTIIAAWLCQAGAQCSQRMLAIKQTIDQGRASRAQVDEAVRSGNIAADAFGVALALERNSIQAYCALVTLFEMAGQAAEGAKYARQGLAVVREMQKAAASASQSSIASVRNAGHSLDEVESALETFLERYGARTG